MSRRTIPKRTARPEPSSQGYRRAAAADSSAASATVGASASDRQTAAAHRTRTVLLGCREADAWATLGPTFIGLTADLPGRICQTGAIRTTLDIDGDLMRTLLARLPGRSKTDAIEYAIEVFLADDSVDRLKKLAGTLEIDDLSSELRALDRTT